MPFAALITCKGGSGNAMGVIINDYTLDTLSEITTNRAGMGETGEVVIGKIEEGEVVFLSALRYVPNTSMSRTIDSKEEMPMKFALKGNSGVTLARDYRNVEVVASFQYIPSLGWGLVAKIDKAEAFASIRTLGIIALIIGVISAAVVTIVGIIFAISTARPIRKLIVATDKFKDGDLKFRAKVTRRDEIGLLIHSFNDMAFSLEKTVAEQREAKEALQERVREMAILNTLIQRLSANISLDKTVQVALEEVNTIFAPDFPDFTLLFLRRGNKLLLQGSHVGCKKFQHVATPTHLVGECLCGQAVKDEKPIYSSDIQVDTRATWGECLMVGLRSFAALPLMSGEKVIGLLGVASGTKRDFGKQARLLEALSNEIAIGLQNALLYEEVRKHSAELTVINEKLMTEITVRKQAEMELEGERRNLENTVKVRTEELRESLKKIEDANLLLGQANIKLKELDHLKSMFIATTSHELRTPLNSIIGFTSIMLMGMVGKLTNEQRKQLTIVKANAKHLLNLINDVIDLSKVEAGQVDFSIKEFDLSALVQEVENTLEVAIKEKGLEISLDISTKLTIEGDERRTRQILANLVSNAVKFTDRGKIKIQVTSKNGAANIPVRDTGIGIKKEDMDKLFKQFSRIPTEGRLTEGTGLGLYLCQKISAFLGAEIKAESEFGKGSVFTLSIPLNNQEPKDEKDSGNRRHRR